MVVLGTLVILRDTDIPTDQVIFEVISAFGTVGLSTGITADLPETSQLMLTLLMYVGRVGTITLPPRSRWASTACLTAIRRNPIVG